MNPLSDWLAMVRVPGFGPGDWDPVKADFPDLASLRSAPERALQAAGLRDSAIRAISEPDLAAIETDLRWLDKPGRHLVTWDSAAYPPLLRQIPDAPWALFVAGDPAVLAWPQLAIVGSRNPTPDGREAARAFAAFLASRGIAITSGLATGIDGAAHEGALQVNGVTLAICGTGLDRVYPDENRALAGRIAASGAVVSEFPVGTPPARHNFPRRNRIISGLSVGTLVVEAARRSGSLITAHQAMDQGREVFAMPGSVHNPLSRGCHQLIREGAKLVETAADILEEIAGHLSLPAQQDQVGTGPAPMPDTPAQASIYDSEYRQLLDSMGFGPQNVDALVARTGLTADAVSSMLLILELQGQVLTAPGGGYVLSGERSN